MTFTELITQAFRIWWRHKSLWVIGVVLALCGRGAYGFSVNYQQRFTERIPSGDIESPTDLFEQVFPAWLLQNLIPIIACVVVLSLLFWLIGGLLAAWAHAAITHMAAAADADEPIGLGAAFGRGRPLMLRLFGLELVLALPGFGLSLVVLGIGAFFAVQLFRNLTESNDPSAAFGFIGLMFCLVPLILLIGLLSGLLGLLGRVAMRACVLEDLGVFAGIGRAWRLARRNFGYLLLIWLMLIALATVFGLVAGLPALALLLITGPSFFDAEFSAATALGLAALAGYGLVVGVLMGGALTALNETIWTLAFRWFVARSDAAPNPAPAPGL